MELEGFQIRIPVRHPLQLLDPYSVQGLKVRFDLKEAIKTSSINFFFATSVMFFLLRRAQICITQIYTRFKTERLGASDPIFFNAVSGSESAFYAYWSANQGFEILLSEQQSLFDISKSLLVHATFHVNFRKRSYIMFYCKTESTGLLSAGRRETVL